MYVMTSLTDQRVPPYGPIRYIAKLRRMQRMSENQKDEKPLILLNVEKDGSHFGSVDSNVEFTQVWHGERGHSI